MKPRKLFTPKKWIRMLKRHGHKIATYGLAALALVTMLAGIMYKQSTTTTIDPAAYRPLLDTIAKGESNGNYNAYFGNAANTTIDFTKMPVREVLQWQADIVQQGSPSSAVGKYQIIRPTLAGLVQQLKIDDSVPFSEELQDRMAIALMERRGSAAYIEKKLTREQFAANLAKEWAALPKITGPTPDESYYAKDGLNKARIPVDEVYSALSTLKIQAGN
jgi:conjugal transfer mating pair stabilization protein TraG